jgi:hypothetical protein
MSSHYLHRCIMRLLGVSKTNANYESHIHIKMLSVLTEQALHTETKKLLSFVTYYITYIHAMCHHSTIHCYGKPKLHNFRAISLLYKMHIHTYIRKDRVLKKGLQALWGYSTHLNEKESPSQRTSTNQCLLRYGLVLHLIGYSDNTTVCITRSVCNTHVIPRKQR